ncbi:MAG: hypothetical protein Q4A74_05045 [Cardiobacteriaceae bacterium]|nr:hypothetical protein [Cardiobacteriaceae bacterium]
MTHIKMLPHPKKSKWATLALCAMFSVSSHAAVSSGTFTWHLAGSLLPEVPVQDKQKPEYEEDKPIPVSKVNLAFVDTSTLSQQWIGKYADYLIEKRIPVIVIGSSQQEIERLFADAGKKGLLIGAAPEPRILLDGMLQRLHVTQIPAAVEGRVVWQVRDSVPPKAFEEPKEDDLSQQQQDANVATTGVTHE